MIVLAILIGVGGIAAAAWFFWRTQGTWLDRVIQSLIPLSAAGLLFMGIARIAQIAPLDWGDAKLAPIIAMTKGYSLYQDPASGVMTAWIYGPIGAIILLPTAIASDPTTAGLIGSTIAILCYAIPAAWWLILASKGGGRWIALLAFLILGWRTVDMEVLCRSAFIAASDAPALGFTACACALITLRRDWLTMGLSALAAVLCIWTKQNYALLLVALVAWVLIVDGWKPAAVYAGIIAAAAVAVSVILMAAFGASNMFFHMFTLPLAHPYANAESGLLVVWLIALKDQLLHSSFGLGLVVLALLLESYILPPSVSIRAWFAQRRWPILILAAIALLPGGLTSYSIVGGYVNSLAATDFCLLLGALAGIVESCAKAGEPANVHRVTGGIMAVFGAMMAIDSLLGSVNGMAVVWPSFAHPYQNTQQVAFQYARNHRNQVYCPWAPLVTLMTDGKLYHFEWGLLNRVYAYRLRREERLKVSEEQFDRHIPADLKMIVYVRQPQSTAAQEVLEGYRVRVQVADLPGCMVWMESGTAATRPGTVAP